MMMVGMIGNTREDVDDSVEIPVSVGYQHTREDVDDSEELHVSVRYQHPFSSQARAWLHL